MSENEIEGPLKDLFHAKIRVIEEEEKKEAPNQKIKDNGIKITP